MMAEITDCYRNYSFTSGIYFYALVKWAETPKSFYRAFPVGIEEC